MPITASRTTRESATPEASPGLTGSYTLVILADMKTAVSLPEDLFRKADKVAGELGIPRSRLFATALEQFLANHRQQAVTERLDAVYGDLPPGSRRTPWTRGWRVSGT